ncbi:hypothetical protein ABZX62_34265 [Streptomyces flavidovirens]|uniref:hypothetical protein n=1 Tax=Streptomyces flavidovirens TaxID=67298 RepID=UPI0033A08E95
MASELAGRIRPQWHSPADQAQNAVFVMASKEEKLGTAQAARHSTDDRFSGVAPADFEPSLHPQHEPAALVLKRWTWP